MAASGAGRTISGKRVIIVMPAYNAETTLARTVAEVPSTVDEIVVDDDHSNDRTVEVARAHGFSTPWLWLGLVAVVLAARSLWRIVRREAPWEPKTTGLVWAVTVLSIAGSVTLMPALTVVLATVRYLGDIAGSVALLGALGAWCVHELTRGRAVLRRSAAAVCWLLAVPTIAAGLALGLEGQYTHFLKANPTLMQNLQKRFSVCGDGRS